MDVNDDPHPPEASGSNAQTSRGGHLLGGGIGDDDIQEAARIAMIVSHLPVIQPSPALTKCLSRTIQRLSELPRMVLSLSLQIPLIFRLPQPQPTILQTKDGMIPTATQILRVDYQQLKRGSALLLPRRS